MRSIQKTAAQTKQEIGFRLVEPYLRCSNCANRDYGYCTLHPGMFTIGKLDNHVCDRWKRIKQTF